MMMLNALFANEKGSSKTLLDRLLAAKAVTAAGAAQLKKDYMK
jgi:hypothetical protein